jgi:hypothetical protein
MSAAQTGAVRCRVNMAASASSLVKQQCVCVPSALQGTCVRPESTCRYEEVLQFRRLETSYRHFLDNFRIEWVAVSPLADTDIERTAAC